MGILNGLIGNASKVDIEKKLSKFEEAFLPNETIEAAFQMIRDLFVFTDKRMILIDKQGITGKKTEFLSIPYRSIAYVSVESAGHFDLDSELKIFVRDMPNPICKNIKRGDNIWEIQNMIIKYL